MVITANKKRKRSTQSSTELHNTKIRRLGHCPRKNKITTEMYYPSNANLDLYKQYHTRQNRTEQTQTFYKFIQHYYKCLCNNTDRNEDNLFYVYTNKKKPRRLSDSQYFSIKLPADRSRFHYLHIDKQLMSNIINCNKRYYLCTLGVNNIHANSVIFDIKNKTMIRFEPHGRLVIATSRDLVTNEDINKVMNAFKNKLKYKRYVEPLSFCPKIGPQVFERNNNFDDMSGFCHMFNLLFVCYVLDYPGLTLNGIMRLMYIGKNKMAPSVKSNLIRHNISTEIRVFTNLFMSYTSENVYMREIANILMSF